MVGLHRGLKASNCILVEVWSKKAWEFLSLKRWRNFWVSSLERCTSTMKSKSQWRQFIHRSVEVLMPSVIKKMGRANGLSGGQSSSQWSSWCETFLQKWRATSCPWLNSTWEQNTLIDAVLPRKTACNFPWIKPIFPSFRHSRLGSAQCPKLSLFLVFAASHLQSAR